MNLTCAENEPGNMKKEDPDPLLGMNVSLGGTRILQQTQLGSSATEIPSASPVSTGFLLGTQGAFACMVHVKLVCNGTKRVVYHKFSS